MLQNSHHLNLAISSMDIQPANPQQLHYSTMSMWTNVSITLLNLCEIYEKSRTGKKGSSLILARCTYQSDQRLYMQTDVSLG